LDRPPKEPQRFKLALFDLDGTLTRERSAWEYLHRHLGVWEGNAEKYQEAFLRGEIDYTRFCELDAAVWKGMKVSAVQQILREIPLYEGVDELVKYLKSRGIRLGIISSGLSLLSDWMREKYGFDYAMSIMTRRPSGFRMLENDFGPRRRRSWPSATVPGTSPCFRWRASPSPSTPVLRGWMRPPIFPSGAPTCGTSSPC
jgi:HAD superfamily phosphoserine phosphatase-like hydrolase